jgi:hypothetical protein
MARVNHKAVSLSKIKYKAVRYIINDKHKSNQMLVYINVGVIQAKMFNSN